MLEKKTKKINNKNNKSNKINNKINNKKSPVKVIGISQIKEYIVNSRNNIEKIREKRSKKGKNSLKSIVEDMEPYVFNKKDDNTIYKDKNRCMCIDFDIDEKGKYTLKNNPLQKRCNHKTEKGKSFCKKHTNCRDFYKQTTTNGYEPTLNNWSHPYVEGSHNCYSYFVDDINKEIVSKCKNECINNHKKGCPKKIEECGDFKPQPGDYHMLLTEGSLKNKKRIYKCPQMEKKIMNDNPSLIKRQFLEKCPPQHYKGSMVIDPDHTFHFYRQNKDGTWSHKPGTLPVTDKDADGKVIYAPHFSNRDYTKDRENSNKDPINYTDVCGYYCIPENNHSNTFVI